MKLFVSTYHGLILILTPTTINKSFNNFKKSTRLWSIRVSETTVYGKISNYESEIFKKEIKIILIQQLKVHGTDGINTKIIVMMN